LVDESAYIGAGRFTAADFDDRDWEGLVFGANTTAYDRERQVARIQATGRIDALAAAEWKARATALITDACYADFVNEHAFIGGHWETVHDLGSGAIVLLHGDIVRGQRKLVLTLPEALDGDTVVTLEANDQLIFAQHSTGQAGRREYQVSIELTPSTDAQLKLNICASGRIWILNGIWSNGRRRAHFVLQRDSISSDTTRISALIAQAAAYMPTAPESYQEAPPAEPFTAAEPYQEGSKTLEYLSGYSEVRISQDSDCGKTRLKLILPSPRRANVLLQQGDSVVFSRTDVPATAEFWLPDDWLNRVWMSELSLTFWDSVSILRLEHSHQTATSAFKRLGTRTASKPRARHAAAEAQAFARQGLESLKSPCLDQLEHNDERETAARR
jgi:hypothetical protein